MRSVVAMLAIMPMPRIANKDISSHNLFYLPQDDQNIPIIDTLVRIGSCKFAIIKKGTIAQHQSVTNCVDEIA